MKNHLYYKINKRKLLKDNEATGSRRGSLSRIQSYLKSLQVVTCCFRRSANLTFKQPSQVNQSVKIELSLT
jgi:hypothetical protein